MSDPIIYRHRRTPGDGPPANLYEGEIAYSDKNHTLHVGKPGGGVADIGGGACFARQELSPATPGGTFTAGNWIDRPLTHISGNESFCEVQANGALLLVPGDYEVMGWAIAVNVQRHRARLVTASNEVLLWGDCCYAGAWVESRSFLAGHFKLTSLTAVQVQHRCQRTQAVWGFGVWSNFGPETYVQLTLNRY